MVRDTNTHKTLQQSLIWQETDGEAQEETQEQDLEIIELCLDYQNRLFFSPPNKAQILVVLNPLSPVSEIKSALILENSPMISLIGYSRSLVLSKDKKRLGMRKTGSTVIVFNLEKPKPLSMGQDLSGESIEIGFEISEILDDRYKNMGLVMFGFGYRYEVIRMTHFSALVVNRKVFRYKSKKF